MTALLPLLLGLASASAAEPSQESAAAVPVSVEVDVSALPDTEVTQDIGRDLRDEQVRMLIEGGFVVTEDADATIRVTVSRWGDGAIHYRYEVALIEGAAGKPTAERKGTCELCTDSELYTKIGEEVARVSGRLMFAPQTESEPETNTPPEPEVDEPDPTTTTETQPPPRVRRVGGAGWAGIGVAAAGLAVAVGGAVVLLSPDESTVDPGAEFRIRTSSERPLGGALLGVGLGVLATGAVLIVVDQTLLLKRRRDRAGSVTLVPSVLPAGIGLTWSGRF